MKILVTGGSGFIGSALAKGLISKGHEVLNFDLISSPSFPTIIGDITNRDQVFNTITDMDYVYHLAAIADINYAREQVDETIKVNVGGTYNIASACRKFDVPLAFASTLCVYGETPEHPSWDNSVLVPTELYALTKVVGETIITGLVPHHVILRFGTTYGPGLRDALAISIFIRQALADKPLTIDGSGKQTRQFIYIDDLIDALVKVIETDNYRRIFSLAGSEELSVNQIAEMILVALDKPPSMKIYRSDRPGQIMREDIDIEKTKKILGWTPKTKFKDGLEKTIEWIKRQAPTVNISTSDRFPSHTP